MKHIVSWSGGVGSWATGKRVVAKYGTEDTILLFADTLVEDPSTYRFNEQASAEIGVPITRIADGRTPWQVFRDRRFIGNSRVDPCSQVLKRELLNKWVSDRFSPADCIEYIGIDWSEIHRLERHRKRRAPYRVEAPMCEPPYLSKDDMLRELANAGIDPPNLYQMGFPHNNCGGFCVKAGQAQFALLLREKPEYYAENEAQEESLRADLGKDVSVMRDRRGGTSKPLTMKTFRERIEAGKTYDLFDYGGCGCAL